MHLVSEKSFSGYGVYAHHSRANRTPLREAFSAFLREVNGRIASHTDGLGHRERPKCGAARLGMSHTEAVRKYGARVARVLAR
ncbi:MAG: hypothetical protein WCW78_01900 [Candidatus Paceibacterota bacterium]|jgi:hypothetical protein